MLGGAEGLLAKSRSSTSVPFHCAGFTTRTLLPSGSFPAMASGAGVPSGAWATRRGAATVSSAAAATASEELVRGTRLFRRDYFAGGGVIVAGSQCSSALPSTKRQVSNHDVE